MLEEAVRSSTHSAAEVIPLVEETASVDKRDMVTGRLRMQTVTETVEELADADVQWETVEVTWVRPDHHLPMGRRG